MDGWIIDGVMYINTGQVSRKTKTKESPTDSRPSSPTGKKKKKKKKKRKKANFGRYSEGDILGTFRKISICNATSVSVETAM